MRTNADSTGAPLPSSLHSAMPWLALACANLIAFLFVGFSYRIPGGVDPRCYLPAVLSGLSLAACGAGARSADAAGRFGRLLCAAACLYVLATLAAQYSEFRTAVYHAYNGLSSLRALGVGRSASGVGSLGR